MRNASANNNGFKSLEPALLDAVNRYSSDLLVVLTPNHQLKNRKEHMRPAHSRDKDSNTKSSVIR